MFDFTDIKEKAVLFRCMYCREDMADEEIYEWFRGVWPVSLARVQNLFVFGVMGQFGIPESKIIRVYRVNEWHEWGTLEYQYRPRRDVGPKLGEPTRYEFTGEPDLPVRDRYYGKILPWTAQNAVRYVNA